MSAYHSESERRPREYVTGEDGEGLGKILAVTGIIMTLVFIVVYSCVQL